MEITDDKNVDIDLLDDMSTENKRWCVYKHTNKLNGKVYIGQTCQNPKYRWGSNGSGYKRIPHFWNAIQKYGWENFEHEVLFDNLNREDASRLEIELIAMYDSVNPENGYNTSTGGFFGVVGFEMTDECKRKISESLKGVPKSETAKQNMSKAKTGVPGKPRSEEHQSKIIAATMIPIIQISKNGEVVAEYPSISEAARIMELSKGAICSCCKKKRKTVGGFKWQYKDNC